jgi:hypothetical protein
MFKLYFNTFLKRKIFQKEITSLIPMTLSLTWTIPFLHYCIQLKEKTFVYLLDVMFPFSPIRNLADNLLHFMWSKICNVLILLFLSWDKMIFLILPKRFVCFTCSCMVSFIYSLKPALFSFNFSLRRFVWCSMIHNH